MIELQNISTNELFGIPGLRKKINTSPNYSSAVILNNLVKAYNLSFDSKKLSQNIKNFALGINDESNILKLNYGLKNISPNNSKYMEDILILGKGIIQKDTYIDVAESLDNLFSFKLSDIYSQSDDISNCFLLGAIYLTYDNETAAIEFSLAKPKNENEILILHKDCKISDIEKILKYDTNLKYESNSENNVLLYKFIVDIESYQNIRRLDRYFIYLYDIRMPEGLFNLSDEQMHLNMTNDIIIANNRIESFINAELNIVTSIIRAWSNLSSWEPSFQGYWSISEKPMPDDLKTFINNYLGISI